MRHILFGRSRIKDEEWHVILKATNVYSVYDWVNSPYIESDSTRRFTKFRGPRVEHYEPGHVPHELTEIQVVNTKDDVYTFKIYDCNVS